MTEPTSEKTDSPRTPRYGWKLKVHTKTVNSGL
jgi:hypothetical protein